MEAVQARLFKERETIAESFLRFHRQHPEVLSAIVEIAREAKGRGYRTWSINGVFEILRWSRKYAPLRARLGVEDGEGFALNNNYRSRYARLISETVPDLKEFFATRSLKSE